ncbi:hypothetical protein EUX98_g3848 [Antrodiella citrinella]|uniref:Uncharacterized protein n=1 Tax=Antrodiella citrinella TaxID=2447956 RepID=A0A4S4MVF7_9APHY|nr:hypothetical protein EUX98_g3848 [Antrodiella citrinella]
MPPKVQPKTYILSVKTHKVTFFITASQTSTIASLKAEVLSALQAPVLTSPTPAPFSGTAAMDVDDAEEWKVPTVSSEDEFELCRAIKDKGKPSGRYERMEGRTTIKASFVNWDMVFVQFKDTEKGIFHPVKVSLPSMLEDDEDEQPEAPPPPPPPQDEAEMSAVRKGKRKARSDSPPLDD